MHITLSPHHSNWKPTLQTLVSTFGIPLKELSSFLKTTNSVLSGGSIVCTLSSYCDPNEYDGDLDIFIPYVSRTVEQTKLLTELQLKQWNYISTIEPQKSKFSKPEECPVCYTKEGEHGSEFIMLEVCKHWCCDYCISSIQSFSGNNRCPICRTDIVSSGNSDNKQMLLDEDKKLCDYQEMVTIRCFKEYTHSVTGKKIQCIYVSNIQKTISRFDLSVCQSYFDGRVLGVYHYQDVVHKIARCKHTSPFTPKQENRIKKYILRGFSIRTDYACHIMPEIIKECPIEKKLIVNYVYPFLRNRKEKEVNY